MNITCGHLVGSDVGQAEKERALEKCSRSILADPGPKWCLNVLSMKDTSLLLMLAWVGNSTHEQQAAGAMLIDKKQKWTINNKANLS